jgi:hypothetical protein
VGLCICAIWIYAVSFSIFSKCVQFHTVYSATGSVQISLKIFAFHILCKNKQLHSVFSECAQFFSRIPQICTDSFCVFNKGDKIRVNPIIQNEIVFFNSLQRNTTLNFRVYIHELLDLKCIRKQSLCCSGLTKKMFPCPMRICGMSVEFKYLQSPRYIRSKFLVPTRRPGGVLFM